MKTPTPGPTTALDEEGEGLVGHPGDPFTEGLPGVHVGDGELRTRLDRSHGLEHGRLRSVRREVRHAVPRDEALVGDRESGLFRQPRDMRLVARGPEDRNIWEGHDGGLQVALPREDLEQVGLGDGDDDIGHHPSDFHEDPIQKDLWRGERIAQGDITKCVPGGPGQGPASPRPYDDTVPGPAQRAHHREGRALVATGDQDAGHQPEASERFT
jgi:hypothetical protein